MKLSTLALIPLLSIATHSYCIKKLLELLKPIDEQKIEYHFDGYNDVFETTTSTVTFNNQEYNRTPLSQKDEHERIRLELPVFFFVKYVIELQRKPLNSLTDTPKFDYMQTYRGYQLTTSGKILACTLFALFLKKRFY